MPKSNLTVQQFFYTPLPLNEGNIRSKEITAELPSSITYSRDDKYQISETNSTSTLPNQPNLNQTQTQNLNLNSFEVNDDSNHESNEKYEIPRARIYSTATYYPNKKCLERVTVTAIPKSPSTTNHDAGDLSIRRANEINAYLKNSLDYDKSWFSRVIDENSLEPLKQIESRAFEHYDHIIGYNEPIDNCHRGSSTSKQGVKLYQLSPDEWEKITNHKLPSSSPNSSPTAVNSPTSSPILWDSPTRNRNKDIPRMSPLSCGDSPWNSDIESGNDSPSGVGGIDEENLETSILLSPIHTRSSRSFASSTPTNGQGSRSRRLKRRSESLKERLMNIWISKLGCCEKIELEGGEEALQNRSVLLFGDD